MTQVIAFSDTEYRNLPSDVGQDGELNREAAAIAEDVECSTCEAGYAGCNNREYRRRGGLCVGAQEHGTVNIDKTSIVRCSGWV